MEQPLMRESRTAEGSNHGAAPRSLKIDRRGDAFKTGTSVQQSAALVDIAWDGEGLPVSLLDHPNFSRAAYYYLFYNAARPLWLATYAALLLLNFVEIPSWCPNGSCGDPKKYWLGDIPYLQGDVFLAIELTLLVVLTVHILVFPLLYAGPRIFRESRKDAVSLGLLLLLFLDILRQVLNQWTALPMITPNAVRLGPYLRVLLVLISVKEIRDNLRTVVAIIPSFLDIFLLGVVFLLFSSWLAYVLFEDTLQARKEFPTYGMTTLKLFILLTGANNPDVWQPAYEQHRAYSLFFVLFLLLGLYFLTNLVLAVIFDSFKEQLGTARKRVEESKRKVLSQAFKLLDAQKRGYVDSDQLSALLKALNEYRAVPHIEKEDMEHIFLALDDSGDYKIDEPEFGDLCDAIGTKFVKVDEAPFLQVLVPGLWNTRAFTAIKDFVKDPRFDKYVMTAVLLANLVTVAIETTLDMENLPSQALWQDIEYAFGWVFVLEMVLKISAFGFCNYWRQGANRFDFVITWIILIGQTALLVDPTQSVANKEWIRYLLIARMLRLLRLLTYVERYRALVNTFLKLIPAMGPLFGVLFGFLSLFTSLGVHLFGGLVYEGNPRIDSTPLGEHKPFNFNDYSAGMITLFNCLCEASFQDWMESYAVLCGSKALARGFFIAFIVVGTYLVMNVFVSFVMEAFTVEMEIEEADRKQDAFKQGKLNLSAARHGQNVKAETSSMEKLMDKMFGDDDSGQDKDATDAPV